MGTLNVLAPVFPQRVENTLSKEMKPRETEALLIDSSTVHTLLFCPCLVENFRMDRIPS